MGRIHDLQGLGDGMKHEPGVMDRRQVDEDCPIVEGGRQSLSDGQGEAGLANPRRADRREEANVDPMQELLEVGNLRIAPEKRCRRRRKGVG
jgi:hypothetical protein